MFCLFVATDPGCKEMKYPALLWYNQCTNSCLSVLLAHLCAVPSLTANTLEDGCRMRWDGNSHKAQCQMEISSGQQDESFLGSYPPHHNPGLVCQASLEQFQSISPIFGCVLGWIPRSDLKLGRLPRFWMRVTQADRSRVFRASTEGWNMVQVCSLLFQQGEAAKSITSTGSLPPPGEFAAQQEEFR